MNARFVDSAEMLTWFDVERRIASCTSGFRILPNSILSVKMYSDEMRIDAAGDCTDDDIRSALHEWFADRELELATSSVDYVGSEEPFAQILLAIDNRRFPVFVGREAERRRADGPIEPLWRNLIYLADSNDNSLELPKELPSRPKVVCFHSFKGGVGRTTSLLTFVAAWASRQGSRRSGRILIIDADLEAPGITYWLSAKQRPMLSFVRFLEALHSPPTSVSSVIDYFARELRKNSTRLGNVECFILPAFVDEKDLLDSKIKPEHLIRYPDSAWSLGDQIHALGAKLGVDYVFVDLRAGLSELSSPLLFDPRFECFIVTTIAEQSVRGMELLLRTMVRARHCIKGEKAKRHPMVVVGMLNDTLRASAEYGELRERIESAYGRAEGEDLISSNIRIMESSFSEDLMSLRSFDQALPAVNRCSLFSEAIKWFDDLELPESHSASSSDLDAQAASLAQTSKRMQFAESGEQEHLLVTDPLRNLVRQFVDSPANTVIIGAKGSGKTFNYLQLCRSKCWREFVARVEHQPSLEIDAVIMPVLASAQLENKSFKIVQQCHENAGRALGSEYTQFSLAEIRDRIDAYSKSGQKTVGEWTRFWVSEMSRHLMQPTDDLPRLNEYVRQSGTSVIFLIDGLEDIIRELVSANDIAVIEAVIDLPTRIRELREPSIGVLVFVREDYARLVKTQNFAQFEERYSRFQLAWSPREFLQLAYWLCGESQVIDADSSMAGQLDIAELINKLDALWGRKLGQNDSAEAYSARWVFAALSDLRGRVQARDLVRFLGAAAERSADKRAKTWNDRVLPPKALKEALSPTSKAKVEEAVREFEALKMWKEKLSTISPSELKTPFAAESLGLETRLRQDLQAIGVIYEDTSREERERYYVPEIYRYGLGIASASGARPRVQALLQKSLGGLPF